MELRLQAVVERAALCVVCSFFSHTCSLFARRLALPRSSLSFSFTSNPSSLFLGDVRGWFRLGHRWLHSPLSMSWQGGYVSLDPMMVYKSTRLSPRRVLGRRVAESFDIHGGVRWA